MSDAVVKDVPAQERYEISVDGERAGLVAYHLQDDVITLVHTEVDDAYQGQGLGGTLARYALEDARTRGLKVRPVCPFIQSWLHRHPDYADLVA